MVEVDELLLADGGDRGQLRRVGLDLRGLLGEYGDGRGDDETAGHGGRPVGDPLDDARHLPLLLRPVEEPGVDGGLVEAAQRQDRPGVRQRLLPDRADRQRLLHVDVVADAFAQPVAQDEQVVGERQPQVGEPGLAGSGRLVAVCGGRAVADLRRGSGGFRGGGAVAPAGGGEAGLAVRHPGLGGEEAAVLRAGDDHVVAADHPERDEVVAAPVGLLGQVPGGVPARRDDGADMVEGRAGAVLREHLVDVGVGRNVRHHATPCIARRYFALRSRALRTQSSRFWDDGPPLAINFFTSAQSGIAYSHSPEGA